MLSDPSITLYAVGASVGKTGLVRKAGCCITLEYVDEYGRNSRRVITHPIGNASLARAHLQAAHLALAAVTRPARRLISTKLVCSPEVKVILDEKDPAYSKTQGQNADVVAEARKWVLFYDRLRFAPCDAERLPGLEQALECAENQKGSDTDTVVV